MYIFTENVENFGSESHFAVDYVTLNMLAGNTGPCNLQLVLEHCSSFNYFCLTVFGVPSNQFAQISTQYFNFS